MIGESCKATLRRGRKRKYFPLVLGTRDNHRVVPSESLLAPGYFDKFSVISEERRRGINGPTSFRGGKSIFICAITRCNFHVRESESRRKGQGLITYSLCALLNIAHLLTLMHTVLQRGQSSCRGISLIKLKFQDTAIETSIWAGYNFHLAEITGIL